MASDAKHTKGPWTHDGFGVFHDGDRVVSICYSNYLSDVSNDPDENDRCDISHDEALANARLIALAPKLLKFAERVGMREWEQDSSAHVASLDAEDILEDLVEDAYALLLACEPTALGAAPDGKGWGDA